jgi:hypothetical protein
LTNQQSRKSVYDEDDETWKNTGHSRFILLSLVQVKKLTKKYRNKRYESLRFHLSGCYGLDFLMVATVIML